MRQSLRRHRQLPPHPAHPHPAHPAAPTLQLQNYFTILHHLYGRKHCSKPLLKIESPQEAEEAAFSERLSKLGDSPAGNRSGKSESRAGRKYSQPPLVGEAQRKNWKNGILRRKNNGSHGEIIRGFAHNRHFSVLERAAQPQLQEIKNSLVVNSERETFIPLGTIHQERPRPTHAHTHTHPHAHHPPHEDLHIRRRTRQESNESEARRSRRLRSEGDEMARTYAPGRLSNDNNFIRRVNLSTPARREKLSPWEVITQR